MKCCLMTPASSLSPHDVCSGALVSAAMTRAVVSVAPELTVEAATRLLLDRHLGGAPVVDAAGRPVGMVSKTDLLRAYANGCAGRASVGDVMMSVVFSVPEGAPLAQAAAIMAFEGIHRIAVVDARGAVVGLVSTSDVVRWLARQGGYAVPSHPPRE